MKISLVELTSERSKLVQQTKPIADSEEVVAHLRFHELYTRSACDRKQMVGSKYDDVVRELILSLNEKVAIAPTAGPDRYGAVLFWRVGNYLGNAPRCGE